MLVADPATFFQASVLGSVFDRIQCSDPLQCFGCDQRLVSKLEIVKTSFAHAPSRPLRRCVPSRKADRTRRNHPPVASP